MSILHPFRNEPYPTAGLFEGVAVELTKRYPSVVLGMYADIELTIDHPELNSGPGTAHLANLPELCALAVMFGLKFDGWDEDGFALMISR